jgi:alpha-L-fucosidase
MDEKSGKHPTVIGRWDATTFDTLAWKELTFDLTPYVTQIGQYEVRFQMLSHDFSDNSRAGLDFKDLQLEMYGHGMNDAVERTDGYTFRITRSQQTLDEFKTVLKIAVRQKPLKSSGDVLIRRITY